MPHEENPSKRQLDLGHQPCQSLTRPALTSVSGADTATTTTTTTTATTKTTTTEGSLGLGISLDSELDKRKRLKVPCSQANANDGGGPASHLESPAPSIDMSESLSPHPLPLLTIPVNGGLENINNGVVSTLVPAKVEILLPILSESDTQLPDSENRAGQEPRSVSTDGDIASGGKIPSQPTIENGHRSPPAFEAVGSPLVFQSHLDDPPLEPNWNPYDELETRTRPDESTYRSNLACRVETVAGGSSFIPSEKPFDGGLTALEWSSGSNTGTSLLPPFDDIHPEPRYPQHYQEHYSQLDPGLQSWSPTLGHSHSGQVARSSRSKRVRKSTATPPNMMSVLSPVDAGHDQECYFGPSQPYQSIQQPSYHQHHLHHRQHPLDSYPYPDPSRRLHRDHDSYNQMHLGQSNGNPGHMYSGSSSQLGYMPSTHLSLSDAASAAIAADMNGHDLGYTSYTPLSTTTAYPSIFGSSEGSYSTNYQDQHQQGGQSHHQLSCHSNHDPSYSDHYTLALSQPLGMVSENLSLSSKNGEYPRRNLSKQELQAMDPDPKYCFNCHTRATPSWRRCPEGRILLCNACGLYQKLHGKPRPFFTAKDGTIKIHRTQAEHDPCHLCGVTSTPIWRKGPQEENLCNACNLLMKQPQQQEQQPHTQGQRQKSTDRHYAHQHQHLHPEVFSEVVLSPSAPSPTTWQMHAGTGGGHGDDASEVSDSMGSTVDSLSMVRFDEGETFSIATEDSTRSALGNNSRRLRATSRNSNSPAPNRSRSTRSMTK
ncbi:hypothetical protein EMPS_04547 [Entomortierella parvispora]|uniref:GATA-type domain-containing protein n=1 Tax=Entomortierella parvispora TaxID=205924 RepID=A0A9P3LVX3_9FUNG|nr:hypothetical protein EMPS_04547 [Entomortierella parvispora]